MTQEVDVTSILKLLPHRYPFILVDKVLSYEPGVKLTALKNVTLNEPFFQGHFPDNPIMPGVLIIEAMAQACVLLSKLTSEPKEGYDVLHVFAGIDNAKFKSVVRPGDQLRFEVKHVSQKRVFWRMQAEAYVGDKCVCSADLLSAQQEIKRD